MLERSVFFFFRADASKCTSVRVRVNKSIIGGFFASKFV